MLNKGFTKDKRCLLLPHLIDESEPRSVEDRMHTAISYEWEELNANGEFELHQINFNLFKAD